MTSLRWTKEPPTEPGWYWLREARPFEMLRSRIIKVRDYEGKMCIDNWEIPNNAEWAGPIPKPEDV